MNASKTLPLNEEQLINLLAQKFLCNTSVGALKKAIQDHTQLQTEAPKSPSDQREIALIMQSAQGIYFGAFTKWLSDRIQKNDFDEHFTDADVQAGINRDTLVNPYIGMIPAAPRMKTLDCEHIFLAAKTKTLESMVGAHAAFQRQVEEQVFLLSPGETIADAIISFDYDKSPNGRLSKRYKKMSNWLLNFDEASNIYISTYTSILECHHEATGRGVTIGEGKLIGEQLYKFLNGAAHLSRHKGMTLVHQLDICKAGIDLSYAEGSLTKVTLSGSISDTILERLNGDPMTKSFLNAARANLLSTGCPAVHVNSRHDNHSLNLLQISMKVFLQNLEQIMFQLQPSQPSGTFNLRIYRCPHDDSKPS